MGQNTLLGESEYMVGWVGIHGWLGRITSLGELLVKAGWVGLQGLKG